MSLPIFATWRTSADVADDMRLVDDVHAPMGERLAATLRFTMAEYDAHHAAVGLLWRARVRSTRGRLVVPPALRTIPALAAPLVVVLSAIVEVAGWLSDGEVFARFGLAVSDASWIVEAHLIAACLVQLVRLHHVERSGESSMLRASTRTRRRLA